MIKKLTATQRAKNARIYKQIRKQYNKIANKGIMTYVEYKNEVFMRSNALGINPKTAAIKLNNTELFVSRAERGRTNFIRGMKEKHNYAYNQMKNLSRNNKGQYVSMSNNLVWDEYFQAYVLGDRYLIELAYPDEVNIIDLETNEYVD